MRRGFIVLMLTAGLLAPAAPALAQVRIQMQQQIRIQPNVIRPQGVKPMILKPVIPPSAAAQAIMNAMPGAKVLKLRNLPTGDIVGTVRLQNQLRNIRVNGKTGAVGP